LQAWTDIQPDHLMAPAPTGGGRIITESNWTREKWCDDNITTVR